MNTFLKQKRLFRANEFELTDRSLKMKTTRLLGNSVEIELKFEDITQDHFRIKRPKMAFIYVGAAMLLGLVITTCSHFFEKNGSQLTDILFYALPLLLDIILLFVTYEDDFNLKMGDGRVVTFFYEQPSSHEFQTFVQQIKQSQSIYLLETYAKPNPYLASEQVSNNLLWLHNRDIINDDELNDLRLQLLPKPKAYSPIGFRQTNP